MSTPDQREVICNKCGAKGPRDCSSARHILANDIWSNSFKAAWKAQEQQKTSSLVKKRWQAVRNIVKEAQRMAVRRRQIEATPTWPWGTDDEHSDLQKRLKEADRKLQTAVRLKKSAQKKKTATRKRGRRGGCGEQ